MRRGIGVAVNEVFEAACKSRVSASANTSVLGMVFALPYICIFGTDNLKSQNRLLV